VTEKHSHAGAFESEAVAAALEIEGELTAGLAQSALVDCAKLFAAAGHVVRRIVDLGCGPGVSTVQLARAFPAADVVGVDGSQAMLDRAVARRGHRPRITWEQLDLNDDLARLGRFDLVWTAMVVHHADDPVGLLSRIGPLMDQGGLLCILERAGPTSISLDDDLGRPGIWGRLAAARRSPGSTGADLPGAAYAGRFPSLLAAADLELIAQRWLESKVPVPAGTASDEFVARHLSGTDRELGPLAEPGDAAALRRLVESMPSSRRQRWGCAEVTISRRLFIAARQNQS
jgi:SAM-dependent methyltransferase